MTCAVSVVISWVSFIIISVPGAIFLDFIFLVTSEQRINGQLAFLKKSGPSNQLLLNRAVAHNPRVPVSAGLSPVLSSTVVTSRISVTRFATKKGCFSKECNHCSTVVKSVHIKHLSIFSETAGFTSCRNRDASKADISSNFGIVGHFMGSTLALLRTKANSVVSVPLVTNVLERKPAALKTSSKLSPSKCNSNPSTVSWK